MFIATHRAQTDEKFWSDLATTLKAKAPAPNAAELIFILQFIAVAFPLETAFTWDPADYNTLLAQLQQAYLQDHVGFVSTLSTLKGRVNTKIPRATAAGLAQSAVALSLTI